MPQIKSAYRNCSIYLYPSEDEARRGARGGGSGFIVQVVSQVDGFYYYLITNSHVIREAASPVVRLNDAKGNPVVLNLTDADWTHHPDGHDIAISPIDLDIERFNFRAIDSREFVHLDNLDTYDVGIGQDVFMVGRLMNNDGKNRNEPSVRFGNIARMHHEPVKHYRGHMQESFLVDMRSISGYSGSPVFVAQTVFVHNESGFPYFVTPIPFAEIHLLGIDWGHIPMYEPIEDGAGNKHPHGWKAKLNTSIATVVPAWHIYGLLNQPEFMIMRQRADRKKQDEKDHESKAVMDAEVKDRPFTGESFQDALQRASRKVSGTSEPDSKDSQTSE